MSVPHICKLNKTHISRRILIFAFNPIAIVQEAVTADHFA